MHISLDGFVAGANGELNWIKVDQELFDYVGKRINTGETAMYGRNTYQMMEGYWPTAGDQPNASQHDKEHSKWYKQVKKVVMSHSMKDMNIPNTTFISDNLSEQLNAIKKEDGSDILVFGSPTATHALLQQNLIDGFWLFVNPIVLGEGIPLFKGVKEKIKLNLMPTTHRFASGVFELNYEVERG